MSKGLLENVYNPDVLTCLANLSNDEVFTSPDIVNKMLDMLPQDLFENPDTTFLDPACKTGVFLREIAKRLIKGLEKKIPNLDKRLEHIFKKQLFGISVTELTSLLSRRSVYCSKWPNGEYSIANFDTPEGNIRYRKNEHVWKNGSCVYCGASQKSLDRGKDFETHAYEFIHKDVKEIFDMKFDVIIGNPPYQLECAGGGSSDRATPIYNKFVEQAQKLNATYVCMIIPSKWMVGGFGLKQFRTFMYNNEHLKKIVDFEDSAQCFPGVHIDGGVCYFLIDKKYSGETEYEYYTKNNELVCSNRNLKNKYFDYVIRDARVLNLVDKVNQKEMFSDIVSTMNPFGVNSYLFNEPERYPLSNLQDTPFDNSVKAYGVKGIKGGAKRVEGYIDRKIITTNIDAIDKYKTFFSCTYSTNAIHPPKTILAEPNMICTSTFLMIGPFNSREEQLNCEAYMNTKFFKTLLYLGKGTMHVTKAVFSLIPLLDFSKSWTDEELYKKYNLGEDEIKLIETMVDPTSYGGEK